VRNSIVTAPPRPQTAPKPLPPILDPRQEPEGPEDEKSKERRKRRQGLRPGQLDMGTASLLHRQKELSSRRCYLQNFWYAAGEHFKLLPPLPLCFNVVLPVDCSTLLLPRQTFWPAALPAELLNWSE